MHSSSSCKHLVFAAINWTQANLCMVSDKEKAADKKLKAKQKLVETAAKKKKDDEEAQVAASFLEQPPAVLGASDDDSDRESGPR
eukprot:694759-Rhodomonas_salina.1